MILQKRRKNMVSVGGCSVWGLNLLLLPVDPLWLRDDSFVFIAHEEEEISAVTALVAHLEGESVVPR